MGGGLNRGGAVRDALLLCGGAGSRLRAGGSDERRTADGAEARRRSGDGERGRDAGRSVDCEKPLVEVGGVPMFDRVCAALAESRIERVHAVVSPTAPATRARARDLAADRDDVAVIETPGAGYVADLERALSAVGTPVLTAAADLPLLDRRAVDRALAAAGRAVEGAQIPSLTVCVPAALKRRLGASVDAAFLPGDGADVLPARYAGRELAPTGLNVVGGASDAPGETDADARGDTGEAMFVSDDVRLAMNVNRPGDLELARALIDGGARGGDGAGRARGERR